MDYLKANAKTTAPKINAKLTLNLGLRYEYESPMTSSNNIYSRVDTVTGQVLFAGINASSTLPFVAAEDDFGLVRTQPEAL